MSPRLEGLEMTLREVLTRAGILDAEPDSGLRLYSGTCARCGTRQHVLAPDGRATCIKCRGTLQAEVLQ